MLTHLVRDDVRLAYLDTGPVADALPLLLVHGWGGDHSAFAPQIEHFARSHRVIAVDLRGFGASDKPKQDYAVEGYADDLRWICGQLGVESAALVGHSMGGVVTLAAAARYPELVKALILCDAPVAMPAGLVEAYLPIVDALAGPDYLETTRGFVSSLFLDTDNQAHREQAVALALATPQHVLVSSLGKQLAYDTDSAVAACKMPVLSISSQNIIPDPAKFRELCPSLRTAQTVGCGHFHQLEAPTQVNAMIEAFLATAFAPT